MVPSKLKNTKIKSKPKSLKNKSKLSIHYLNCRSGVNKEEEIFNYIEENDPDVLTMVETWMDESVSKNSHEPPGYQIIRLDRSEIFKETYGKPGHGGGIAVLYKKNLQVDKIELIKNEYEEILWLKIKGKKPLLLGTVYITDYCNMLNDKSGESKLERHLIEAVSKNCEICLLGDFNKDLLKKDKSKKLKTLFKNYKLNQLITEATRINQGTKKGSLIDHIWTNSENVLESGTTTGLSDHKGTFVVINKEKTKNPVRKIRIRNFKKFNKENFDKDLKTNLEESNFETQISDENVNLATETLVDIIKTTLNKYAPIIEINANEKKQYMPWYNEELKNKIKTRKEMVADSYIHKKSYKNVIKEQTNIINSLKKFLKTKFVKEELEKAGKDEKELWRLINFLLNSQKSKNLVEPDNLSQEKVNDFNKFFATIGHEVQKELNIDKNQNEQKTHNFELFKFEEENEKTVEKIIDTIKKDVATGCDDIPPKIIKESKTILSPYITKLINLSYKMNIFPDILKKAIVNPIYKKDDKNDISNYRPISILTILSKIFEKSAANQLLNYFETHFLINNKQHAYRKFHSTITCLFELINYVHETLDQRKVIAIVSLDLSKAFDSINHDLLLKKLKNLNLNNQAIEYISSYLKNRLQVTKMTNFKSIENEINRK